MLYARGVYSRPRAHAYSSHFSPRRYWDPGKVPTPGNEKVHLNLWQANSGAPGYGRRVHVIVAGFE
jgi:hypothetical protein